MTPEVWREVRELLDPALDLPPAEQSAYLNRVCAGRDPQIRRELESLLAAARNEELLAEPVMAPADDGNEKACERLGPYVLEEQLGRGGMGTVYRASRDDGEFLTSVAVKVLNRGLDTDYFIRRFRYERQLLAYLDHPAIVRLLDGGSTPDGRPYLVTEFVDGEPLPAYLARTRLPLRQRLALLLPICDAVHHAHQRLILHCDLKPNNILVNREGHPKLLDFGVGRIFLPSLGSVAQTNPGQKLITPGYASPEQVRGEPLTTATDVFSLGATLFELICGRTPFRTAIESEREDPGPPSRHCAAAGLEWREVAGDLDLIVAKAMEASPGDRYESAEHLAADLRRFLGGEPILARPQTATYRIWKFVRRNRALAASFLIAAMALVGGAGVALWQRRQALQERDYAQRLYENSRQLARAFVFEMDDRLQREGAIGARRLIVERGLQSLDQLARDSKQDDAIQRDLVAAYQKMGDVLGRLGGANLGRSGDALRSYERALEISRELARRHPASAEDQRALAMSEIRVSGLLKTQGTPQAALDHDQAAARILEDLAARQPSLETDRALASLYHDLGGTYSQMGRWTEVLAVRRQAIERALQAAADPGATVDDQIRVLLYRTRLGSILTRLERFGAAETEFQEAIGGARRLAAGHPESGPASDALSNALFFGGLNARYMNQPALAEQRFAESYRLRAARSGKDPQDWRMRSLAATSLMRWGQAAVSLGDTANGIRRLREALQIREQLADADRNNAGAQGEVGEARAFLGFALEPSRPAEARLLWRQAEAQLTLLDEKGQLNQVLKELLTRLRNHRTNRPPRLPLDG